MIPAFNHSHVLPPFLGAGPMSASDISPYVVSMHDVSRTFAHLPGRARLLKGLRLPSTSPAYAGMPLVAKALAWRAVNLGFS